MSADATDPPAPALDFGIRALNYVIGFSVTLYRAFILGGIAAMGINGFVLGPVIAALFVVVWHIHGTTGTDIWG